MGGSPPPPPPTVVYAPPPPPPAAVQVPTQSLQTQTALNEVSGAQMRLNMELGAQLDRTNSEFFAGQDIRRTQATGAEQRLSRGKEGEEERLSIGATGEQYRLGLETAGKEQRTTDLQQEMFRRYKEQRDYEQAQQQYRA